MTYIPTLPDDEPQVEKRDFKPLPKGNYVAVVSDSSKTRTSQAGNRVAALSFELDGSNRRIFHDITFSEKTDWKRVQAMLKGLGLPYKASDLAAQDVELTPEWLVENAIDRACIIEVGVQAAKDDFPARNTVWNIFAPDADVPVVKAPGAGSSDSNGPF